MLRSSGRARHHPHRTEPAVLRATVDGLLGRIAGRFARAETERRAGLHAVTH
jgi:hypothetical protein